MVRGAVHDGARDDICTVSGCSVQLPCEPSNCDLKEKGVSSAAALPRCKLTFIVKSISAIFSAALVRGAPLGIRRNASVAKFMRHAVVCDVINFATGLRPDKVFYAAVGQATQYTMDALQEKVPSLDRDALQHAASQPSRNPGPWHCPGLHAPRYTTKTSRPAKQDGVGLRYGEYWVQGKRPSMEDAHASALDAASQLTSSTTNLIEEAYNDPENHFAFFGIFDGHGGSRCAEYSAARALKYVQQEKLKQADTRTALRNALLRVENEWIDRACNNPEDCDGTCAAVVIVDGKNLVAASIGDSEMLLCRGGRSVPLCEVHSPGRNEAEAKRVEEIGGTLDFHRMRVIDPSQTQSLAISRTIGDVAFKMSPTGVTAEPDIRTYTLGPEDEFFIIGCDGVWDVVEHQEAIDLCGNLLRRNCPPSEVARILVEYAFAKGSTDNISACVVALDHNATPIDLPPA